jgi:hypothetical protein
VLLNVYFGETQINLPRVTAEPLSSPEEEWKFDLTLYAREGERDPIEVGLQRGPVRPGADGRTTAAVAAFIGTGAYPAEAPAVEIGPEDVAYVAFASGSTGENKVEISLCNLFEAPTVAGLAKLVETIR